ncbi:hypothetical protein D7S89_26420 [Trinickia fusca]|uniref:Uncharacterized protein n=1 Tax=Trinickia fusca TaxID=2419777 RepID=A0A494X127_9BURK|nr:hypothetical protein D7S89_26420 [Trinickia fusca]
MCPLALENVILALLILDNKIGTFSWPHLWQSPRFGATNTHIDNEATSIDYVIHPAQLPDKPFRGNCDPKIVAEDPLLMRIKICKCSPNPKIL